ncbi:MAG TPA: hypothetical protein VN799_01950 [Acidimicrobiales bacterium]|nr:hypothetical protein [Acidimicrobiales bacterium]
MSESDTTTGTPSAAGFEPPTEEIFVTAADGHDGHDGGDGPSGSSAALPWDPTAADDDDEWPDRGPRKGIRMSVPTVALLGLLIAAGGIWGGAALQRSQGTSTSTGAASTFASLFGGRGAGTTGGLAGGGALGAAATGTVTEVQGSTLYVTNASGALVKVTVGPSVTVNRNAKSSLGSLQVGDTVVVQGTKATDGSVTASSVSATAAGVTSGFGGFGGRAAALGG